MSILKATDSILRKVNSLFFRVILVFYSFTVLYKFGNAFSYKIYLAGYVVYAGIYAYLIFKRNFWLVVIRLLNDYLFILMIIWGKSLNDINISIFLFLPLINTLNHSSDRRPTPFPIILYVVLILSLYILNNFTFNTRFFIPIIAISAINTLFYIRLSVMDFSNNLYTLIEQFYQENFNIGKTHLLFQRIMKVHKNVPLINKFIPIEHIALFKIGNSQKLQILISSQFIIKFNLQEHELLEILFEDKRALDFEIEIDGIFSNNNVFLLNSYQDSQYVFFVAFKKKPIRIFFNIYLNKILVPLLSKITNIISVEYVYQNENKKYFAALKQRLEDIDIAVNAIHFLNNKLSPITSYFSMLEYYEKMKSSGIKDQFHIIIEREKKNAMNNILPITDKMNQMAEKASNPNIISDTKIFKLRKLFTIIRTLFENSIIVNELLVEWDFVTLDSLTKSNTHLFEFIIEELIINLAKHSNGFCTIKFRYNNDEVPIIEFSNKVKSIDKNKKELIKIIDDFNNERMSEIMKRNSKGLKIIKQYLEQLDIEHKLYLVDDILSLVLTIRRYESSDI